MTAPKLVETILRHAERKAAADPVVTFPESFVIGWLTQGLEDAYECLMRCSDPEAKTFLAALNRRHSANNQ